MFLNISSKKSTSVFYRYRRKSGRDEKRKEEKSRCKNNLRGTHTIPYAAVKCKSCIVLHGTAITGSISLPFALYNNIFECVGRQLSDRKK